MFAFAENLACFFFLLPLLPSLLPTTLSERDPNTSVFL